MLSRTFTVQAIKGYFHRGYFDLGKELEGTVVVTLSATQPPAEALKSTARKRRKGREKRGKREKGEKEKKNRVWGSCLDETRIFSSHMMDFFLSQSSPAAGRWVKDCCELRKGKSSGSGVCWDLKIQCWIGGFGKYSTLTKMTWKYKNVPKLLLSVKTMIFITLLLQLGAMGRKII